MEDHGSSHPLLQSPGAGTAAATTLAYAWGYQQQHSAPPFDEHRLGLADTGGGGDHQHQQQLDDVTTAPDELRRALVRALTELHASRAAHQAELRRMESEAARLAALVSSAAAERDELRRHCHSLLLLLHHPPPPAPSLHAASTSVLSAASGGGGCATAAAAVVMMNNENAPDAGGGADDTEELEMALARSSPGREGEEGGGAYLPVCLCLLEEEEDKEGKRGAKWSI